MAQAEPRNPPARTSPTRAPTWRQSKAPRWASRRHSQATIAREQTLPGALLRGRNQGAPLGMAQAQSCHLRTRASTAGAPLRGRNQGAPLGMAQAQSCHLRTRANSCRRTATWSQPGGRPLGIAHAQLGHLRTRARLPAHRYVVATRGAPLGIAHAQLGHLRTRASTAGAPLRGRNQGRTAGHRARPVRSPSHESKHCRRIATWRQAGARRLKWRRRSHATFA